MGVIPPSTLDSDDGTHSEVMIIHPEPFFSYFISTEIPSGNLAIANHHLEWETHVISKVIFQFAMFDISRGNMKVPSILELQQYMASNPRHSRY